MNTSRGLTLSLLVGVGALGSFGCEGGNTVTGLDAPGGVRVAEGVRKVAAPMDGLTGVWSGTITFHAYDDIEGDSSPSPCDGQASITVALDQNGQNLSGQFQSGCGGRLNIRGVVVGTSLSGSLDGVNGPGFGRIFGTVSSSSIAFRTVQVTDDEDDNGKDNDGDAAFTSSDVDLHRSSLSFSEREIPVRAAADPLPRVLAPRP